MHALETLAATLCSELKVRINASNCIKPLLVSKPPDSIIGVGSSGLSCPPSWCRVKASEPAKMLLPQLHNHHPTGSGEALEFSWSHPPEQASQEEPDSNPSQGYPIYDQ